ncbi:hypothetical protein Gohar_024728, partial [Gossypium harknessii]|nr:hypothetical protein [Gossypium harknessii]
MWIGAPPSNTRTGFQVRMRDCSFSHNDNLGIDDYFHLRSIGIPMRRRTSDDIVGKLYGCGE